MLEVDPWWLGSSRSVNDIHLLTVVHMFIIQRVHCNSMQFWEPINCDMTLWSASFSKQTKQHVDTTTLSCLGPPVLSQRFQCCTSWSKKQCHTYFQQIAVNTRELPQQETFFCITHQKKPPFFHGLKPFHIHIIHSHVPRHLLMIREISRINSVPQEADPIA